MKSPIYESNLSEISRKRITIKINIIPKIELIPNFTINFIVTTNILIQIKRKHIQDIIIKTFIFSSPILILYALSVQIFMHFFYSKK